MKDNFDLQKYLTENKVFEEFNPFMAENARTDAEEEGYLDGEKDEKKSLRDKVREMVLAELSTPENIEDEDYSDYFFDIDSPEDGLEEAKKDKPEEEEEDVEVEDTEEFTSDDEMDMEDTTPDLEADEKAIMDNLEQALEFAKQKGDEKLIDQIGNTITFFTRQYIVK
jgi:hypothetical protein